MSYRGMRPKQLFYINRTFWHVVKVLCIRPKRSIYKNYFFGRMPKTIILYKIEFFHRLWKSFCFVNKRNRKNSFLNKPFCMVKTSNFNKISTKFFFDNIFVMQFSNYKQKWLLNKGYSLFYLSFNNSIL
jgi:hypothetical protein